MTHSRYAIYYLPPPGPLADFGAAWLGWDVETGRAVPQPDIDGIAALTETPRKYGFHATLKPPFRLAPGRDAAALLDAVAGLAGRCPAAQADGLALTLLGRFLALTAKGDNGDIARVAAACVGELDTFRAPPTADDLARRRRSNLSERQDALLMRWGYPYVMEEFRFHMTLTARLSKPDMAAAQQALAAHLPALPAPFVLDAVSLVGERASDGRFELIRRFPLSG